MRFLRKIIIAVSSIILLAGIKITFKKIFPHSAVFHYNLFSSLQLLLLLWAIGTGLLEYVAWKNEPPATKHLKSFFSFLAFLILAEAGCSWMLHHPSSIPPPFMTACREYYNNYQRDILQYNKNISRYDPAVFYRMITGNRSLFANIEFADSIFTDDAGFRTNISATANNTTSDPAKAAANRTTPSTPKIICLGDSYTLGWGVQQEETYPAQLQSMLNQPVLNTGMSSYGTIREVQSTRSLDKSAITTIIIQYCFNDADENKAFVGNHFLLSVSPERAYDSAVNMLWWSNLYFPGKYFCTLAKFILAESIHPPASPAQTTNFDTEATWFLEVLRHSGLNFDRLHVFVFDIREYQYLTGKFIGALQQQLNSPDNRLFFKGNIYPLSVVGLLTPADYYILDEHLRPSGQKKLADYLANSIRRSTGDSSVANKPAAFSAPALVK
jgi:hypothetical protein